jgi:nitrate reductase assembly molybdenum cofactor insertion protein NarJ
VIEMSHTDATPGSASDRDATRSALAAGYRLIADCFVYPEDVDREALATRGREEVVPSLEAEGEGAAARHLEAFLAVYEDVSVDEYVSTLELDPTCPLYVGHYAFEEPDTCRDVADADRNQYMVELNGIYEHFGFELGQELPDYLPAMVEFLWLTIDERDDPVRGEYAAMLSAVVPGMRERFESAETPYHHLVAAAAALIERDLATSPVEVDADGSWSLETPPTGGEGA